MSRVAHSSRADTTDGTAGTVRAVELGSRNLERIADLVYRLFEQDLLRAQERAGLLSSRWR
jgi:hypothetical protein